MHSHSTSTSPVPRMVGDYTWHDRAACRSADDPELFFPHADATRQISAAKAVCQRCTVRRACLDAALEDGDREGIRGGLTEEEREPFHRDLPHRLDQARVSAALAGRHVHLSEAERQAVVRAAYAAGTPLALVARVLMVREEHVAKLYRRLRREERNRALIPAAPSTQRSATVLSRDDVEPVA